MSLGPSGPRRPTAFVSAIGGPTADAQSVRNRNQLHYMFPHRHSTPPRLLYFLFLSGEIELNCMHIPYLSRAVSVQHEHFVNDHFA
jgi:hypothetical protein